MTVLVTGGTGFLGGEICRRLAARGDAVRSFGRRHSDALGELGVEQHRGDLADPAAVSRAVRGCDAVVHTAALAGVSGTLRPYWAANVVGTRTVLEQCRRHGVGVLVHTSSPSVVFPAGGVRGADESLPYPRRHLAAYPLTKATAEAEVLDADGPGLATVALRPHLIWGPGDPHLLPSLLRAVRGGRLVLPGDGGNLVDTTHVRTAAHAHLLALDRLTAGQPSGAGQHIGGRAYFVSEGEPRPLREIATALLATAGVAATWRRVPVPLARTAAAARDHLARLTRDTGTHRLSRFLVGQLVHPHWFDLTAARRDLGFAPVVGVDAGLAELAETGPAPAPDRAGAR